MDLDAKTGFIKCVSFNGLPFPNRIYLHKAGSELVQPEKALYVARQNLIQYYYSNEREKNSPEWVISMVWSSLTTGLVLDVFEYRDAVAKWPGNPDVSAFNIGKIDTTRANSCGDSLIMLGVEEKFRRDCRNLKEYFE